MDNSPIERLKSKIEKLNPWFDDLKDKNHSIHDVVEYDGETWVIWSDKKGYSVSHMGYSHGCKVNGVSGTHPDLRGCIEYIYWPNVVLKSL